MFAWRETGVNPDMAITKALEDLGKDITENRLGMRRKLSSQHWKSLSEEQRENYRKKAENGEIPFEQKPLWYVALHFVQLR
jgi:hypothetical protein